MGVVKDPKTGKYLSESIEVEFKNPIQTLDVAFAWRHNGETAKVDFYNGNDKVGYAIVSGGGNDTEATVKYYDQFGNLKETVKAQGGTDNVDLVYTFKPAGDVTFTKAVFSADGAGSDYLIHSIKYKEVVDGDSTTIVGSSEVAFKIETSNIPDPSKYDFKTTFPTAHVKIVDGVNNIVFEGNVNLDKDGKAIVSVRTDGTTDLTATVSDVQGNFEKVDYSTASTTIVSSLSPQAGNDSIEIFEDKSYTLKSTDFGDKNKNVAKIKFTELPENGKIYVLKSEYTGSINDRAEYTSSENKIYVEIKVTDIVDISQINKGNVIFVPNEDTDDNGNFKFSVSNGNGNFSGDYITTINVVAVADTPTASIDVTKIVSSIADDIIVKAGNNTYNITEILANKNDIIIINGDVESGTNINSTDGNDIVAILGNIYGGSFAGDNGTDYLYLGKAMNKYEILNYNGYEQGHTDMDFQLKDKDTGGILVVNNIEGIIFADGNTFGKVNVVANTTVEYSVDLSAALTDTDGSEILTAIITGVPAGATFDSQYVINDNGVWKIVVPQNATSINYTDVKMTVPLSVGAFNLTIEATATEESNNNSASTYDSDAIVYAVNETNNVIVNKTVTNLSVIFDVSGSMVMKDYGGIVTLPDGTTTTRFAIAKESLIKTIESYISQGGVNLNLTLFGADALNVGWKSGQVALDYVRSLSMSKDGKSVYSWTTKLEVDTMGTDYYDAITEAKKVSYSNYTSGKNVAIFMSDGEPNDNQTYVDNDNDKTIKDWKTYIDNNKIDLNVIGIGKDVSTKYLDVIQVQNKSTILVANETQLVDTMVGLTTVKFEGDVLQEDGDKNIFGGDGIVKIDSIEVNGTIYSASNYTNINNTVTIDNWQGKLEFNFATGKYSYTADSSKITSDTTKTFKVNVSDTDTEKIADKESFDVNIKVDVAPNETVTTFNINSDADTIDLTTLISNSYKNITDVVAMTNGKINTLKIDMSDVVDLVDTDKQLVIKGDLDDKVDLDTPSDWSNVGKEQLDGVNYKVYTGTGTNSTIKLLIEDHIDITPDI